MARQLTQIELKVVVEVTYDDNDIPKEKIHKATTDRLVVKVSEEDYRIMLIGTKITLL